MFDPNQKRLLALDGGGIMGVITLQLLKRMESQLRAASGNPQLVLSDFFDYIGGTSTGAIIATGLAMGKPVDELIEFYDKSGRLMFKRAPIWRQIWHKFHAGPLSRMLKEVIGPETFLEMQNAGKLKSQLLIVTRNATTDSAWPLSSNRLAKYNDLNRPDCNLRIPLWQLVRASTAAPTYFAPEIVTLGDKPVAFVDGGITPYNSPAFLIYKMATNPVYKLGWPVGEDKLMLVSLGTGFATNPQERISTKGRWLIGNASSIPSELMRGIARENDMNCRFVGRCVHGAIIDREIGNLIADVPLSQPLGRAFVYARYDADISPTGLKALELNHIDRNALQMDNVDAIDDMKRIGEAAAAQIDLPRHFATFVPPPKA